MSSQKTNEKCKDSTTSLSGLPYNYFPLHQRPPGVMLPEEDPELLEDNLRIAETQKGEGRRVVLVRIGKLTPPRSRLQDVRLEPLAL